MTNQVKVATLPHGKWNWLIVDENEKLLAQGPTLDSEKAALQDLFTIFFGDYDDSYLDAYAKWQELCVGDKAPDSYIRLHRKPDAPDPEKHMEQLLKEKANANDVVDTANTGNTSQQPDADGPNYEADLPDNMYMATPEQKAAAEKFVETGE